MSRSTNAIKNASFGILSKIINLVLAFVSRTLFIYILGDTYLGVNGLYSEILDLLSFAELGFGSALTFAMYKPVAESDRSKIIQLLDFYKLVYRAVAAVVALAGLCVLPFLQYIVKGADWLTVKELKVYFLIFLFNTVIGYFVSYKYSYLNALQLNYIVTNIDTVVKAVSYIAQILVIVVTHSFLGYLLINTAILFVSRAVIAAYLNFKYPILREKPLAKLPKADKNNIFCEVKGLAVHQFSSVAVHSTDNILISTLSGLGVVAVGYISNYNLLINAVLGFVTIVFSAVTSGFGNLVATSDDDHFYHVFNEINFLNFWIYGFCCICFWILVPPFITLWIGADKLVDSTSFTLIIINCFLQGQSTIYNNARIAKGNFNKDKIWALLQAIVNLVVSMLGAKFLGLVGIYIGTVASRLVYVIFRPYSTYYFLFGKSAKEYYFKLAQYFLVSVIAAVICYSITKPIITNLDIGSFIVAAVITFLIPNLVFLLIYRKSSEFQKWKCFALKYVKRR